VTNENTQNWSGEVLLWEDHGLFIGRAGFAELHESPAIKVCISDEDAFGITSNGLEDAIEYSAAVIPAGIQHSIDGRGVQMAMILVAPEGDLGQRLSHVIAGNEIRSIDSSIVSIIQDSFFQPNVQLEFINDHISRSIELIANAVANGEGNSIDPRVLRSIEWIRAGRESGILVKDIAAEVDLSEGRFSHLFSENVRVPVRRYLLWLRLRDALHMLATAENLTEAAHSAGFADSAHLSRTFRSALGITPTNLIRNSVVRSFLS